MTEFWRRWLLAASVITEATGILLVAAALTTIPTALFDIIYYPGEPDVTSAQTLSFALGVSGAVIAGWGATMAFIFWRSDSATSLSAARALVPGLAIWFLLDGAVSIVNGASINVIGNGLLLAMFIPPLVAIRSNVPVREVVEAT